MKKSMHPLVIRTSDDGEIWIEQDVGGADEDHGILLNPAQVPTLIEWLQEAVKEIEGKQS
jgi:hypothetical protein